MPTRSDITVVNSAYDTSGNGGRKITRLSNGWFVSCVKNGTTEIRFYVSKDNGGTWNLEKTLSPSTLTDVSLVSKGTDVYVLFTWNSGNVTASCYDVLNTWTQKSTLALDGSQTAIGNCSLTINETGTELHAAWASKNATYPNSFNIRYAKGTINADGSVSWGAVTQITNINTSGADFKNPCIIIRNGGLPSIIMEYAQPSNNYTVYVNNFNGTSWLNSSSGGGVAVYNGLTYAQSSPSAIFIPQSINGLANGRIWVAWHGTDSTDTSFNNIRISYSDDGGVTWSAMTKLTTGSTKQRYRPSLTAFKDGRICVLLDNTTDGAVESIIYNGGWGSLTVVIDKSASTFASNPSTLFDLTMNISSPLFIYMDPNGRVGFYGTWTVTTISVTPGAIGTKTSADKSNFLTYAITTDGTMTTITEKVNGVTIGTKSATSGQSLIAGLTQAQWDSIKFGKYKDATGGLNTLTVEMGTDLWTYTFDKRLATNEDIAQAVKATQDTQTTYLPSVKTNLATAITSKGGTASGSDSWDTLVSAVGGLGGKRFASGTATSGSSLEAYTLVGGSTSNLFRLSVTGLTFKPSMIYILNTSSLNFSVYIANNLISNDGTYSGNTVKLTAFGANGVGTTTYNVKADISPASVTSTGFILPVSTQSAIHTWIAYE